MFDVWPLLEADFQSEYGIDLEHAIQSRSWRWFAIRATGLLSTDSRIHRRFKPSDDE